MVTRVSSPEPRTKDVGASSKVASTAPCDIKVALLTGGFDRHYTFDLAKTLASKRVCLDVIGSDVLDSPAMHTTANLNFLNLRGSKQEAGFVTKAARVLIYYWRLIRYASFAKPKIFHILWNDKFEAFERTVLMRYYKLLGKKIAFTAHNVNAGKRDLNDSWLNRFGLRVQYQLADQIFVHTTAMKNELISEFQVQERKVTIIPFGLNSSVPNTGLTSAQAKKQLGIKENEKTILFFGIIRPYKGLEYLTEAFLRLAAKDAGYRLIIAGNTIEGSEGYWGEILRKTDGDVNGRRILQKVQFIPDEEIEIYFKAADVLALPYTDIFQSGVLFLSYSFGLPVVGTDVGSVKEDIIEGETGFLCMPRDPADLSRAIERYFESSLYATLDSRRQEIRDYAKARHSWDVVGDMTRGVYADLLAARR
jgi:glycosyltransferase involved in cell wall biosynthesis